jgi:hypothetical protein
VRYVDLSALAYSKSDVDILKLIIEFRLGLALLHRERVYDC